MRWTAILAKRPSRSSAESQNQECCNRLLWPSQEYVFGIDGFTFTVAPPSLGHADLK